MRRLNDNNCAAGKLNGAEEEEEDGIHRFRKSDWIVNTTDPHLLSAALLSLVS